MRKKTMFLTTNRMNQLLTIVVKRIKIVQLMEITKMEMEMVKHKTQIAKQKNAFMIIMTIQMTTVKMKMKMTTKKMKMKIAMVTKMIVVVR